MKRALSAILAILAAAPAAAQGDFVVNYRGLMAGRALVTNGFVDFYRSDTAYRVRLQGPTGLAASRTFTLPATLGTSGQALRTDGAGALSWVTYLLPSDIGSTVQAYHVNLGAIAALTYGANQCTYWTGAGVAATMSCTAAGRSMIGAADAAAQTALLNAMVGDSGAGGTKGLVPAPSAGDAAKFLRADATWQAVSSTITSGSSATSGCIAGGVLRSISNLVDCGAGLTYDGTTLSTGRVYANDTTSITTFTGSPVQGVQIGGAGSGKWSLLQFFGDKAFPIAQIGAYQDNAAGTTFSIASSGNYTPGASISTPTFNMGSTGAVTIGGSGITGTTPPLTISRGSSSGNIANFQTTSGTTVSYVENSGKFRAPSASNSCAAASYGFDGGSGYGMSWDTTNAAVTFGHNGNCRAQIENEGLFVTNVGFGWATSQAASSDTRLVREAAATLQMGADVNGSAVNQTFKAHDGITGTNISGAKLTIAAGRGTGTGSGGTLAFQTAGLEASGTTAQTLVDRVTIPKTGGIQLVTAATKPTCDSSTRGTMFYVAGGAGVADTYEVCRKDAADAYAWVSIY